MSTIRLDITAIGQGGSGSATIGFDNGSQVSPLALLSKDGPSVQGYFSRIPTNLPSDPNAAQASAYAQAFVRDFKNVGGSSNLSAKVENGNEVLITAKNGQFANFSKTGNWISNLGISNEPFISELDFDLQLTGVGDCNTVQYSATLTGGEANYTIKNGNNDIDTDWNGSAFTFNLGRGTKNTISAIDDIGQTESIQANPPRKLKIGEFGERFIQYENSNSVEIDELNPVANTGPLEYALTDLGESSGSGYQASNSFSGVLVGQYLLWIKDKYDCEISKIIEVRELEQNGANEVVPFFLIPEANSLIFSEKVDFGGGIRKNYFNTSTRNERSIGKRHQITQSFFADHEIPTRFLSSYPWHIATITNCDGSKKNLSIATVQNNLGAKEKIDCKLFNVNGMTGVYFEGGNKYEPDTDTVIGASEIDGSTPDWAITGQLVFLDGIGGKYITGEGRDDTRGYYFTVDGSTTDDIDSKVKTTFNKHPYNLFDFFIFMGDITNTAKVEIQYGYGFDKIVGTHISEVIERVEDDSEWHLVRWGDEKNKGDMVYQSFPQPFLLLKGKLDTRYPNSSDTSRGDSKTYSLDQESFLSFYFKTGKVSRNLANKLTIASGTGFFEIDNIRLVKTNEATIEDMGNTNLKSWSSDFDYGGNQLGVKSDELDVLDVSTGVVGGGNSAKGGSVSPLGAPVEYDNKTRFVDPSGNFIVIDGGLVAAD